jgi:hypothetical protein
MMSDTPRTDAVQGGLECATELPEDWEKCFQWMAGHARSLERENAELSDQVMRWFKAASPHATPGSLEGGLDRLRACENALMDLYEANAKGVFSVPDKHYSLITAAAEVLKQDSLAVIAALRRKGWNSAIRRSAEVAEHYAGLMKNEAVQRVAEEIRAMLSEEKP